MLSITRCTHIDITKPILLARIMMSEAWWMQKLKTVNATTEFKNSAANAKILLGNGFVSGHISLDTIKSRTLREYVLYLLEQFALHRDSRIWRLVDERKSWWWKTVFGEEVNESSVEARKCIRLCVSWGCTLFPYGRKPVSGILHV